MSRLDLSRAHGFSPFAGHGDRSGLTVVGAQYAAADVVAESVLLAVAPPPSLSPSVLPLSFPSLAPPVPRARAPYLVYPFNTSLSNRLLHFAVRCSCNIALSHALSPDAARRVSHSARRRHRALRNAGESILATGSDRGRTAAEAAACALARPDRYPPARIISKPGGRRFLGRSSSPWRGERARQGHYVNESVRRAA